MYRVLRNSRTPLFLHRKSNHVFSLWQHIVLLTVRQYEGKLEIAYLVQDFHFLRIDCPSLKKLSWRREISYRILDMSLRKRT
ncbi:MAG: hypothetical protein WBE68_10015, partial [Candidatus Nitrosopolaris sp.]